MNDKIDFCKHNIATAFMINKFFISPVLLGGGRTIKPFR